MGVGPSDDDVLAAVIELSTRDIVPSTSLIALQLSGEQPDSGPFRGGVHDVLRHLEAAGRVTRVTSGGTHRWSPNRDQPTTREPQPASPAITPSRTAWSRELALAVALAYLTVVLVCFAAGYLVGRLVL